MSNIVDFTPADRPSACADAENDRDARHSEAFRDLENRLCDCVHMAKLAFDQVCELRTQDGELVFAVAHTWEMLAKLKRDYYADYHGEKAGGLDKSSI